MENVHRQNGCLVAVPGSHKRELQQHVYPEWEVSKTGMDVRGQLLFEFELQHGYLNWKYLPAKRSFDQSIQVYVQLRCVHSLALPMYRLLIYCSSMQRTAPQFHFLAVPQCSSRHRDGNATSTTYRNTAAVDYEHSFTLHISLV